MRNGSASAAGPVLDLAAGGGSGGAGAVDGGRMSAVSGPKPEGHGAVLLHPAAHEGGDGGCDDTGNTHCANDEQPFNPKAVQDILMAGAPSLKGEKRAITDIAATVNSADLAAAGGSAAGHGDWQRQR